MTVVIKLGYIQPHNLYLETVNSIAHGLNISGDGTTGSISITSVRPQNSIFISSQTSGSIALDTPALLFSQGGAITTAIDTGSHFFGLIGTVNCSLAAQGNLLIPISNTSITNDCIVLLTINSYNGNGIPIIQANNLGYHSGFNIKLYNASTTDALSSVLYIGYYIITLED